MLQISTTNTTGLTLVAVVEKVGSVGENLDPPLTWSVADTDFIEIADITDAYISLQESATITGYYSAEVSEIDSLTTNLRVTILIHDVNYRAIGTSLLIPQINTVTPDVSIDLTVTEDRN
jgi:hypothetical protein